MSHDNGPPYTYKSFMTGKTHRTWGYFEQWSKPTGPLNVRYAIFKTPKTRVCVPCYLLTKETKAKIPQEPAEDIIETVAGDNEEEE